jgi:signal transduction histidine kinase
MQARYPWPVHLPRAPRPPSSFSRALLWDLGLAGAVLLIAQLEIWLPLYNFNNRVGPPGLAIAATTLTAVSLLWRRRAPLAVLAFVAAVTIVRALLGGGVTGLGFLAPILIATFSVSRFETRMRWPLAAVASAVLVISSTAVNGLLEPTQGTPAGFIAFAYLMLAVLWVLGRLLMAREVAAAQLVQHAELLERDQEHRARAAVAEERARIARELHDVVAHSVSVIIVQAQAATAVLEQRPATARRSLDRIESTAREAMAEMRRLVGILDEDEASDVGAPQPGLAQMSELVATLRDAGPKVEVEITGEARDLSAGLDLAAYRVIQESLTNVLKHSGAQRVCICLRYAPTRFEIEVIDDGRGCGDRTDGGHGLIGMRQRVALYGGRLEVGDHEAGGFAVRATFPIETQSR